MGSQRQPGPTSVQQTQRGIIFSFCVHICSVGPACRPAIRAQVDHKAANLEASVSRGDAGRSHPDVLRVNLKWSPDGSGSRLAKLHLQRSPSLTLWPILSAFMHLVIFIRSNYIWTCLSPQIPCLLKLPFWFGDIQGGWFGGVKASDFLKQAVLCSCLVGDRNGAQSHWKPWRLWKCSVSMETGWNGTFWKRSVWSWRTRFVRTRMSVLTQ